MQAYEEQDHLQTYLQEKEEEAIWNPSTEKRECTTSKIPATQVGLTTSASWSPSSLIAVSTDKEPHLLQLNP